MDGLCFVAFVGVVVHGVVDDTVDVPKLKLDRGGKRSLLLSGGCLARSSIAPWVVAVEWWLVVLVEGVSALFWPTLNHGLLGLWRVLVVLRRTATVLAALPGNKTVGGLLLLLIVYL